MATCCSVDPACGAPLCRHLAVHLRMAGVLLLPSHSLPAVRYNCEGHWHSSPLPCLPWPAAHLQGTKDFPRLRIGIGRPPGSMPVHAWVLQVGIGCCILLRAVGPSFGSTTGTSSLARRWLYGVCAPTPLASRSSCAAPPRRTSARQKGRRLTLRYRWADWAADTQPGSHAGIANWL